MNASTKLARLETALAVLEKAAGINPDVEVINQRADGSWPEPQTDAPLIVERVNFRASGGVSRRAQAIDYVADGNCQESMR